MRAAEHEGESHDAIEPITMETELQSINNCNNRSSDTW